MRRVRRFADCLNWGALVAPGTIACKDGSLLGGWEASGIDTESLEPEAVSGRLRHLAHALSGLGDGQALWAVFDRRPWIPAPGDAPAAVDRGVLDALAVEAHLLLAEGGAAWRDRLTLFLCWRPEEPAALDDAVEAFGALMDRAASRFGAVMELDRLAPEAPGAPCPLCGALAGLLGQARPAPRFGEDDLPVGLDVLLGAEVLQPRRAEPLTIDGRPVAVLALDAMPARYGLAPLARFQDLGLSFSWSARYEALSARAARGAVRRRQKHWTQGAADLVANVGGEGAGRRDRYGDWMAASLEGVLARLSRGEEGHGWHVTSFLVHGPEGGGRAALAPAVAELRAAGDDGQCVLREERENALPALLSALPGHAGINPRRSMLRARAMADLMPSRSTWRGSPHCPSPLLPPGTPALMPARARTGEVFHLNLHCADVGHALVFGPTGAGKSLLLGRLAAAWLRYPRAQVVFFDRQRSAAHACAALGGAFLEPGVAGGSAVAPLAHLAELGAPWGLSWLTALAELGLGAKPSTDQAAELRRAVEGLAREPRPTLRQVWEYVQDRELRRILEAWIEGPLAGAFDADEADVGAALDARMTVFETHALFEADRAVALLALDYVFAQAERRFDGRPTLVMLDEAWAFLAHPLFAGRIRSWLKEGRKNNVAVLLATQSVADAARSELTAELLESCPTKMFLPNPEAGVRAAREQYAALGLEPAQVELVANIRPRRDLYLAQPGGRRVISLPIGAAALSVAGRTSAEDSARALRLARERPEFWKEDLHADSGIDLRAA